jgi:transposase-like protein
MMYPASEKLEIIRLVEESALPVRRTLEKVGVPRATFYRVRSAPGRWAGSPGRPTSQARSRLEPHSRRCSRAHHQAGAGRVRLVAEGAMQEIG